MSKQWMGRKEIAYALGISVRAVNKRAAKESWPTRPKVGRGGGFEYLVEVGDAVDAGAETLRGEGVTGNDDRGGALASPPESTRLRVGSRRAGKGRDGEGGSPVAVANGSAANSRGDASVGGVGAGAPVVASSRPVGGGVEADVRVQARLWLLSRLPGFCDEQGLKKTICYAVFSLHYNRGQLEIPDWVRAAIPQVSGDSLRGWQRRLVHDGGITDRRGQGRRRTGKFDVEGPMRSLVLLNITRRPLHIHRALVEAFGAENVPSLRRVEQWVGQWRAENGQHYALLTDKDKFNSRYRSSAGSYSEGLAGILSRIEIDATKGDLFLRLPSRRFARYSIIYLIDVFSRRIKGFVSPTSTSKVIVQSAIRWILTEWGWREGMALRTDQGKDFISNYTLGAMAALGIEHEMCNGRSGWEKPFVERVFGTNTRQLLEVLPGYCGHNVAERMKIRSQTRDGEVELMLSPLELQEVLDTWSEEYNNTPHSGEGLDGVLSPNERWAESAVGVSLRYRDQPRLLDMLLAEVPQGGARVVSASGLRVQGGEYISPDGLHIPYIGQRVSVRFDPWEIGKVQIFSEDNAQWLFEAWDYRQLGINRAEAAARAHYVQKEFLSPARELRREIQKDRKNPKVVPLTRRVEVDESIDTPTVKAAKDAVQGRRKSKPRELSPQQRARQKELVQEIAERSAATGAEPLDQRFGRLYRAFREGAALAESDMAFVMRCLDMGQFAGTRSAIDIQLEAV